MSQEPQDDKRGGRFALGPWRRIGAGVHLAVADPDAVNLGLVVGSTGCLLVDTGSSPAQGAAVRASVRAVTEVPLVAVVVTHGHHDHFFGLAAFDDLMTIGHESLTARVTEAESVRLAAGLGLDPAELRGPHRSFAVAAGVDLGDRRVEIAHLGAGHTEGDVLVVVADADLVFAGDLIESADAPWFDASSRPDDWATTLDSLIGLMTASTRAIPGHGDPVDREFVFETRSRVASVAGVIRGLAAAGVPLEQALAQGDWAYPPEHIADGLAAAYALVGGPAGGPVGGDGEGRARRTLPLA